MHVSCFSVLDVRTLGLGRGLCAEGGQAFFPGELNREHGEHVLDRSFSEDGRKHEGEMKFWKVASPVLLFSRVSHVDA